MSTKAGLSGPRFLLDSSSSPFVFSLPFSYHRSMSESKAVILGVAGLELSDAERAFYREHRPWGFILFARNVSADPDQIRRLVDDLRDSVGREAPVLIDHEGGRVQRI